MISHSHAVPSSVYNHPWMPFNPPIPNPKVPRSKSAFASLIEAERMMQVALLLPSSAGVGWLIGAWLDKTLHQTWISLAGILFGGISGLVYVVRMVTTRGAGSKAGTGARPGVGSSRGKP
jgi:ATP synthase protein I